MTPRRTALAASSPALALLGLALVGALTNVALAAAEAIERHAHAHAVDRGVRWFDRLRM